MGSIGLALNEGKTCVRDARCESFDFLGYTFGPMYSPRTGGRYNGARPSKKAIASIKGAIRERLRNGNQAAVGGGGKLAFVFPEVLPVLPLEPAGVAHWLSSRRSLAPRLRRASDPTPRRTRLSENVPPLRYHSRLRHDLDAAVRQILLTARNVLFQRSPGLVLGQGLVDDPQAEFPGFQPDLEIRDRGIEEVALGLEEVATVGSPGHVGTPPGCATPG